MPKPCKGLIPHWVTRKQTLLRERGAEPFRSSLHPRCDGRNRAFPAGPPGAARRLRGEGRGTAGAGGRPPDGIPRAVRTRGPRFHDTPGVSTVPRIAGAARPIFSLRERCRLQDTVGRGHDLSPADGSPGPCSLLLAWYGGAMATGFHPPSHRRPSPRRRLPGCRAAGRCVAPADGCTDGPTGAGPDGAGDGNGANARRVGAPCGGWIVERSGGPAAGGEGGRRVGHGRVRFSRWPPPARPGAPGSRA